MMEDKARGWRKLFKPHKKSTVDQKKGASSDAKQPHGLFSPTEDAKDPRIRRDDANISQESRKDHQKTTADLDNDHATLSVPSAREGPSPQAEQNTPNSKSSTHNSLTTPLSTGPDTKDVRPLWDRAYARLRDQKPEVVKEYERILASTADVRKDLPLNETMRKVVDNRLGVMTSRQWKIRIPFRKDQMLVTEVVDKVVGLVLKFKDIGNTVASLDPVHAGIPFAAICFILPVSRLLLL